MAEANRNIFGVRVARAHLADFHVMVLFDTRHETSTMSDQWWTKPLSEQILERDASGKVSGMRGA
eukprot:1196313-Prorocentrum_minimum.AAC.5